MIILGIIFYQILSLKETKEIIFDYNTAGKNQIVFDSIKSYEKVVCNLNISKPEIAYVNYTKRPDTGVERYSVSFYNFQKENLVFGKWNFEYTGGTTIKNTTFPQLLKMVKEDCSQFQKSNSYKKETDMYWTYGKYTPPKPKTKEEIEQKKQDKLEEEEYLRKVDNGEIIPKSTYYTLIESGLSKEAAMDVIKQMKEGGVPVYK